MPLLFPPIVFFSRQELQTKDEGLALQKICARIEEVKYPLFLFSKEDSLDNLNQAATNLI